MGKFQITIVATVFWFTLSGQENGNLKFVLSPVGNTFSSYSWNEYSLGIYKIKNNFKVSASIAALYHFKITNIISLSTGIALRQIKYNFSYIIHNPFDPFNPIDKVNRYSHRFSINPHVGVNYKLGKIAIELGFEPVLIVRNKTNIDSYYGPTKILFDPLTQRSAQFTIVERNAFFKAIPGVSTPTLFIDYSINDRIGLQLTTLFRPYSKYEIYQLDIEGRTPEMPNGNFSLNDTRLNRKLLALYIGFTYRVNKKFDK